MVAQPNCTFSLPAWSAFTASHWAPHRLICVMSGEYCQPWPCAQSVAGGSCNTLVTTPLESVYSTRTRPGWKVWPAGAGGIVYVQPRATVVRIAASALLSCAGASAVASTKNAGVALLEPADAIWFRFVRSGPTPRTYVGMLGVAANAAPAIVAALAMVLFASQPA